MRGIGGSHKADAKPSVSAVAPPETWEATSAVPSFDLEDAEIRSLPVMPKEEYRISSLPVPQSPTFAPLPTAQTLEFQPLPSFDAAESKYEIQQLPAIEIEKVKKADAETEVEQRDDPEIGIPNFEISKAPTLGRDPSQVAQWQPPRSTQLPSNHLTSVPQQPAAEQSFLQPSAPRRSELSQNEFSSSEISKTSDLLGPLLIADQVDAGVYPVQTASAEQAVVETSVLELAAPEPRSIDDFSPAEVSGARIAALPEPLAQAIAAVKKKKKKVVAAPKKGDKKSLPKKPNSKDEFKLAAQPEFGDHYIADSPQMDCEAHSLEPMASDFSNDATNPYLPYDPYTQMEVYQGKVLNANQRPLVELGRPWYQLGQLSPGSSVFGFHNNVTPQFLIFGDSRVAYASNNKNNNSDSLIATQLNLDFDLKLTGTERFHAFVSPTGGDQHNRYLLDEDRYVFEGDANIDFGYFEGDLGAMVGGAIGKTLPFDLPFTIGIIPLVFQNGVWFEDAILGFAATLPARNSPRFNISNMDITFFAGYDKLNSDAFPGDDSAARVIGMASFIEALNGYIEADYAFLDDRTFDDRSYHNIGIGYTRRYGRFLSNSTRVIVNAGQSTDVVENTADGVLLLSENSLITGHPSNIVPYFNMFAGFDRPQSVARAGASGGVLRNTGILFESDNLTGYPTLDATANDTYGFAAGINILSQEFSQQLVLETAMLGVMGDAGTRRAQGDQFGVGFRYQLPLSNSVIFRADGMMGFLRNDDDVSGIRVEMRKKF